MKSVYWVLVVFLIGLSTAHAAALQPTKIVLINGDHLSGSLEFVQSGKLVIKTTYAGTLHIDIKHVQRLDNDKAVHIKNKNGVIYTGNISFENEEYTLVDEQGQRVSLARENVKEISRKQFVLDDELLVSGNVSAGAEINGGNTDTEEYNFKAEVKLRYLDTRHTFKGKGSHQEDNNVTTESEYSLSYKYDRFITDKWFWNTGVTYEFDRFQDLRKQTTVGTGLGYQFWDTPFGAFSIENGLSVVVNDYNEQSNDRELAHRWTLNINRYFFSKQLELFHVHNILNLFESDMYQVDSETGLRFKIFDGVTASARLDWDYDSSPADDDYSVDRKYVLGLGYQW